MPRLGDGIEKRIYCERIQGRDSESERPAQMNSGELKLRRHEVQGWRVASGEW